MSKMLVELANLYRQLIYIWDKGVESWQGGAGQGRRQRGVTRQKALRPFVRFCFIWAQRGTSGQKWAGQICNKVRKGGRTTGSGGGGASICRLCRRTCVVNIAIPWTIIMNEPRGCSPYSHSPFSLFALPLSLCFSHWIVATLCHLICCNLIDNLCNFNEHERFI